MAPTVVYNHVQSQLIGVSKILESDWLTPKLDMSEGAQANEIIVNNRFVYAAIMHFCAGMDNKLWVSQQNLFSPLPIP